MDKKDSSTAVGLILLGAGVFQIIAALIALIVWFATGDWRTYWPQIAVIAFCITIPVSYVIWKRYWHPWFPN